MVINTGMIVLLETRVEENIETFYIFIKIKKITGFLHAASIISLIINNKHEYHSRRKKIN
jgi:hypothetical protein